MRTFFASHKKRYNLDTVLREYENEQGMDKEKDKVSFFSNNFAPFLNLRIFPFVFFSLDISKNFPDFHFAIFSQFF